MLAAAAGEQLSALTEGVEVVACALGGARGVRGALAESGHRRHEFAERLYGAGMISNEAAAQGPGLLVVLVVPLFLARREVDADESDTEAGQDAVGQATLVVTTGGHGTKVGLQMPADPVVCAGVRGCQPQAGVEPW